MKTLIIRVKDAPSAQGWPVELCFDSGVEGWHQTVVASGFLPSAPPRLELPPLAGGQVLDLGGIVPFLLSEPNSPGYLLIGQYLFGLLYGSGIGSTWDDLRLEHEVPRGEGLRTVLEVEPSTLRGLPWEALTDRGGRARFLDPNNPFVRGPIRFLPVVDPYLVPLRILVVVGDPQDARLRWREEIEAIRVGLLDFKGKAEAEFLLGPTIGDLESKHADFKPDVLHFIGHGIESATGLGPALQLNSQREGRRELLGLEIQNRFTTTTGRLAVLNACRSDQTTDVADRVTLNQQSWSLADAFRDAGYRAVVGMQGDIPASASVSFSRTLYQQLGAGQPIDVAVADARKRIGDDRTDVVGTTLVLRDWVLPSLIVTTPPECVLAPRYGVDSAMLSRIELTHEFVSVSAFVDRTQFRHAVWSQLATDSPDPRNLLVVHGTQEQGKTWLVRHALRTCAWRGRAVRYVNFAGVSTRSLLDVLRLIRDGSSRSFISEPLPLAAHARLTHALNALCRGQRPPAFDESTGPPDDTCGDQWDPGEHIDLVFRYLIDVLLLAAGGAPLILALDHLEQVEESALSQLITHFLFPVARGQTKPVQVIVALRSLDLRERWWPAELTSLAKVVPLAEIQEEFEPLAREFARHHGYDLARADGLIKALNGLAGSAWHPELLRTLKKSLDLTNVPRAAGIR